jgi:hypothetical protein
MNMSATSAQNPVNADPLRTEGRPQDPEAGRRKETPPQPQVRDAFERLLREKQERREEPAGDAAGAAASCTLRPLPHPPPLAGEGMRPKAGMVETVTTGPRAAIEAALNANPGPSVTPVGGTDPAAIWEASVCEPNSVAVEVRAVRAERSTAHEAQPSWALTIGSSNVNAEVLARHAPRLNERLRKHAIGLSHVRIEREEPDEE